MKKITAFITLLFSMSNYGFSQHAWRQLWITESILPIPESVFYDSQHNVLFTSLMNGSPNERDSVGSIGKLGVDGKIIDLNWISGLNAPKGMARYKDLLYVADLTELVVINVKQQKVSKKITIEGSKVLNDVTVDKKGVVYISDPKVGKIFRVAHGIPSVYLENLTSPNGLKFIDGHLFFLDSGTLFKVDINTRKKQVLVEGMDENTDGVEEVKKGEYIVSCWTGIIYYVTEQGSKEILYDKRKEEYYSADIAYNPEEEIVYVPSLFKKTIAAYSLK